jgi:hypothetical protein
MKNHNSRIDPKTTVLLLILRTIKFSALDAFIFIPTNLRHICPISLTSNAFEGDHRCNINVITRPYVTSFHNNAGGEQNSLRVKFGKLIRRSENRDETQLHQFSYDCNELCINRLGSTSTTGVILIHPIGVGISKWYYDRLLHSLNKQNQTTQRLIFLAPDLLGSGSACLSELNVFPLLNITDWSNQITDLMASYESLSEGPGITNHATNKAEPSSEERTTTSETPKDNSTKTGASSMAISSAVFHSPEFLDLHGTS